MTWRTTLLMPKKHVAKVARILTKRTSDIEIKYAQGCPADYNVAQKVKVVTVERRVRSVVLVTKSELPLAVNILSDAIMACLPGDLHDVRVPYWS